MIKKIIPMNSKTEIEKILKHRFFLNPTGYPPQNGFLDYGPPLAQIKQQILFEFRKIFVEENVYEIEASAILPYEVLKNSGHIDKFCDVILSDGANIFRADHFIEEKIGEVFLIPKIENFSDFTFIENLFLLIENYKNVIFKKRKIIKQGQGDNLKDLENLNLLEDLEILKQDEVDEILKNFECVKKHLSDCNKTEIDLIVALYNLRSPTGLKFGPSKDFNLIFKLNDKQFLRPELAQSQFTNFRRLYEMNNEKLPFSSLCIGRSYRNEISARGGMMRTKEFEQAEIEYFTEDGKHANFESIRNIEVVLLPNTCLEPYESTLGEAFDKKIISSEAICYFIAKAKEFCLCIGINLENIRFRQHNKNEMAHYANDCWDLELKTLSGWVECAGIADRSNFDLTVHSKDINTFAKRMIEPKIVYEFDIDRAFLGKKLKSKFKDFENMLLSISQEDIQNNKKDNLFTVDFEGDNFTIKIFEKTVDSESFIPRVIEPSFGISRILYALVEQSFKIRDDRNVLSLKPKMCYMHVTISFLKYLDEFKDLLFNLKKSLSSYRIRYQTSERNCSIGRKYSSSDEIGIPYFVTFDFETVNDGCVTVRDRDSMEQIRIELSKVPEIINNLINEKVEWADLYKQYGLNK